MYTKIFLSWGPGTTEAYPRKPGLHVEKAHEPGAGPVLPAAGVARDMDRSGLSPGEEEPGFVYLPSGKQTTGVELHVYLHLGFQKVLL